MPTPRRALSPLAIALAFLVTCNALTMSTRAQAGDCDVPGGHYFTQAGGSSGGYSVLDDDEAWLWWEFQRLGGVAAIGFPISDRFRRDGFTLQAFQRVILQWHAGTGRARFVNVFDLLHDAGKDEILLRTRQVPLPRRFDDQGKPWADVVAQHLAVMDSYPAIREAYRAASGDPVDTWGLPTSDVTDMGNNLALRTQRAVFQLWKEDTPWARRGEVTVALGGDIAKENGLLQSTGGPPSEVPTATAVRVQTTEPAASVPPTPTYTPRPSAAAGYPGPASPPTSIAYPGPAGTPTATRVTVPPYPGPSVQPVVTPKTPVPPYPGPSIPTNTPKSSIPAYPAPAGPTSAPKTGVPAYPAPSRS